MIRTFSSPRPSLWAELAHIAPGALLTLAMVWSVVRSIADANWASDADRIVPVALLAVVMGVGFARLRWLPSWLAHILSAVLALVWVVRIIGPLTDERLLTWRDHFVELIIRGIVWARVLANNGRGEDLVLFVGALALLSWALGYATAWMVFRRGWLWRAMLINAVVILVNYTYTLPKPTSLFFIFLFVALLLLVYQNAAIHQERWNAAQVEYPDFMALRLIWSAMLLCGLVILATSMLPGEITYARAVRTWDAMSQPFKLAREHWEDAFSTINAQPGAGGNSFALRGVTLGGGRVLGNEVVMYVTAEAFEYWRAVAFDKYTGDGWVNTTGEQARFALGVSTPEEARTAIAPGGVMPQSATRARQVVTQTVHLAQDRKDDFITAGGQALRVSLPTLVEHSYAVDPQGQTVPNFDDTAVIVSQISLREEQIYTVTALVARADVQSLRQSGVDYPDWVRARYLDLPATVTPRTLALAQEIATQANAAMPYDKAIAIQDFLRTLPYNEQINAPPPGVDPVDYFLFDIQEGYCDYYASAMVVMLRSLDVPARWVQGYAGGLRDPESGAFVVRENLAHSWPEVYFPGFGWERFEPTAAGYTALPQRPDAPPDGAAAAERDQIAPDQVDEPIPPEELDEGLEIDPASGAGIVIPEPQSADQRWRLVVIIGIITGGIVAAGLGVWLFWRREIAGLSPAARAYAEMGMLARLAGAGPPPNATPYEYSAGLARALPAERALIERIGRDYVYERYGCDADARQDGEMTMRHLRPALFRLIVARRGIRRQMPADADHSRNR